MRTWRNMYCPVKTVKQARARYSWRDTYLETSSPIILFKLCQWICHIFTCKLRRKLRLCYSFKLTSPILSWPRQCETQGALKVAKAFKENIFRRLGATSLIRHDRDPRIMSEVFQTFADMMQSKSRDTLSYRIQANRQQERSVKTII